MLRVVRVLLVAVVLAPVSLGADAPDAVRYELRMPEPASHLFEVAVTARADGQAPVDFQMPAWSPGRYIIFDFARNVQDVSAADADGRALDVAKLDKQTWRVAPRAAGDVVFRYRVYADNLSGTFSQLDARHANFNGASVFVYVVGRKPSPVQLTVVPPKGWRVANGSSVSLDQTEFEFANYDLLVDTPTEVAPDLDVRTFRDGSCEYRVVTHQLEGRTSPERYATDVERIVRTENAVMGVPPDLARYTFLVHFAPRNEAGDGMEHLTSTQIVLTSELDYDRGYDDALSVTAHEFFHVWNVKRLRPAELGPWDYTRENYTTSLWIAEGLTSYYGDLSLARSGLYSEPDYLAALGDEIALLENSPGRAAMSLERSSFDTWLYIAVRPRQRSNAAQTTISYYNKGEVIGALLDLEIRRRTNGERSLDDVFRLMWRRFYLDAPSETYYYKGRGYTGADFRAAVEEVAGSSFDAFFERYVSGTAELDYDATLDYVGLHVARERRVSAVGYGVRLDDDNNRLRVESLTPDGLGAQSGLRVGDVLLRIDDRVATKAAARDLFGRGRVTATPLRVLRDGKEVDVMVAGVPATLLFEVKERADASAAQRAARRAWMGVR
jgi:predicted metalloprotease with PDZ domain